MTLEELKAREPELVSRIEQAAADAAKAQAGTGAAEAERKRLAEIDSIAASVPDQQMVHDAKYGEHPCTAQELCFRVMQQSAEAGRKFLADYAADAAASGTGSVGAAPDGGTPAGRAEQDAADIRAVVDAYTQSRGGWNHGQKA